jgi:hypothetical protein
MPAAKCTTTGTTSTPARACGGWRQTSDDRSATGERHRPALPLARPQRCQDTAQHPRRHIERRHIECRPAHSSVTDSDWRRPAQAIHGPGEHRVGGLEPPVLPAGDGVHPAHRRACTRPVSMLPSRRPERGWRTARWLERGWWAARRPERGGGGGAARRSEREGTPPATSSHRRWEFFLFCLFF